MAGQARSMEAYILLVLVVEIGFVQGIYPPSNFTLSPVTGRPRELLANWTVVTGEAMQDFRVECNNSSVSLVFYFNESISSSGALEESGSGFFVLEISVSLSGLRPFTTYECTVSVVGGSPGTEIFIATTEQDGMSASTVHLE